MESVLHIEPIVRQAPAPLHIGHNEHMFYGETLSVDDENVGDITSVMKLGAPLEAIDQGSHAVHVPLVKTIEYTPDFSRSSGNIYLETIHYLKDRKFLIPFRSKIRSGLGQGLRINHIPSLNHIRQHVTGYPQDVCDPRSEIVCDVLLRDEIFRRRKNQPLHDWLMFELSTSLDAKPISTLSFDADDINDMVPRYINQVRDTPSEYTGRDLKEIASVICPIIANEHIVPPIYHSFNPISHHLSDVRHKLVNNTFDFRSFGNIPVNSLANIEYNPKMFQAVCDLLDFIPLTDFNVDIVLSLDSEIVFYQEHLAVDRLGLFSDNEMGLYREETILKEYLTGNFLNDTLECFVKYHNRITDEIIDMIDYSMVKIKLIKTITDEAAVLLYKFDSQPNDPPLCGVYFDIALQSLAPMSVIQTPVAN